MTEATEEILTDVRDFIRLVESNPDKTYVFKITGRNGSCLGSELTIQKPGCKGLIFI